MTTTPTSTAQAGSRPKFAVRTVRAVDEAAWRELWHSFCTFYSVDIPAAVTASTWSRLLDEASPVNGYVAELDDKVVGFANCVLHPYTWGANPVCYLEDLYVDPSVRGSGVGLALMEHLVELAAVNGWARIYWHTDRENTPARRLYDQLGPADEIVRYTLVANEEHPPRSGPAL